MPLPNANKVAHSGFETQRRHHQKSKTGVSVTPKNGHVSNKIFKKKPHLAVPAAVCSHRLHDDLPNVWDDQLDVRCSCRKTIKVCLHITFVELCVKVNLFVLLMPANEVAGR